MAWPCYMVEFWPDASLFWREVKPDNRPWSELSCDEKNACLRWNDLRPGAMWWDDGELFVKLPSGSEWNIDRGRIINARRAAQGKQDRLPEWSRTGDAPCITATPSINHVGQYHGWLRNGVLTDDCEGRTFAAK
jgi:hypothetical protein